MKINVANKKCIRHLGFQNMKSSKTRNIIAILAIALTTVLFTALFTIAMSIIYGFEQSNFRQVGGYEHGGFKRLSVEQVTELSDDSLIKEWGVRHFLGMPLEEPFDKSHVEVSWCDANQAKFMFLNPIEGRLPKEGTNEAATDLKVLSLLGIEPQIGSEFALTMDVDGTEVTETFTLCGYWEYDEATFASHVLLPDSRVNEILQKVDTQRKHTDSYTGTYSLDVMFKNASHIEENLLTILAHHGYQSENPQDTDTYIDIGVNWGYMSAQYSNSLDFGTAVSVAALLLVIIFTGYLIIYNIFQISVSNDIRFYGLLKTIGTTGRQLRRMISLQAIFLSAAGIPIGLLFGYGVGAFLTPVVISQLNGVSKGALSISPWIFIVSALFSLITVIISCRKPGKMAAKVSPIEAIRYTEGQKEGKKSAHNNRAKERKIPATGASIFKMARANLGRNRKKTAITVISLSLAVVLLNMTITFTNGFDMDKYISHFNITDFIIADAGYFQVGGSLWSGDKELSEDVISTLKAQGGITDGGRTYGLCSAANEFVSEEYYRARYAKWNDEETLNNMVERESKVNGLLQDGVQLFGMEAFCLDKLQVFEGDISKLYENGNYIAAVYWSDDYGNPEEESNWAKLGDKVTIRYTEEWEYYNPLTGLVYSDPESIPDTEPYRIRSVLYQDVEYEVVALVSVPHVLSYRYYGSDEFVMGAETFKRDTGTDSVMYYAFDMEKDAVDNMENFLADYTENVVPGCDYESKKTYAEEFASFANMFLLLGGVLSFIVGLVGILNFLNAILTSIMTRHREFAVLQSVGMTGKQLKSMLVAEGELLALSSIVFCFVLTIVTGPLVSNVLGSMFWFFSYHFTILPIIIIIPFFVVLGIALPLITYQFTSGKSIVERLREVE